MNKIFVWILASLGIALAIFLFFGGYLINDKPVEETSSELTAYFQNRVVTLAVEDIGQPIEGFDSELLRMAYPALLPQDFDGVQAFEGRYTAQSGDLVFVRDREMPISSAERTISEEGYGTLLQNVSVRLGLPVLTEGDVDALIEAINTGERLEVKIGQDASAFGITLIPLEVLEDSRCPVDVTCIQVGTLRVRTNIETEGASEERVFVLNESIQIGELRVALSQVLPPVESTAELAPADYTFWFEVLK